MGQLQCSYPESQQKGSSESDLARVLSEPPSWDGDLSHHLK